MSAMNFLDEIAWRGLLHQTAGQGVEEHLRTPGRVGYCGFDPTKQSLTIGNFMPIKMLMHWQRAGHRPIVLMGGGTGLIGDPSGKDAERQLLSRDQVAHNVAQQKKIMERFLDFSSSTGALLVDNFDWLSKVSYLDMLRDVGKHFSVNMMIQKDSVRDRLHNRDQGISYTEFSYMILQAYDFWHLRKHHGCTVQIAGSDQYGNIVAGMDLIRRLEGHETESFGVTNPLVTNADGSKIGKSEEGAIWLTAEDTSPYRFYQWWINATDENVLQYLRWFTFLSEERVLELEAEHEKAPHLRPAQTALAEHMTELVHGKTELDRAVRASQALFSGDVKSLDAEMLSEVFADVPH
jgi:tyrosyl-tRNA synthetase